MLTIFVNFLLFWFNLFADVKAFSNCPPFNPITCKMLVPLGHLFPDQHNKKLDYEIHTNKQWFMPNEVIQSTYKFLFIFVFKLLKSVSYK